jgi:hypothetical protein
MIRCNESYLSLTKFGGKNMILKCKYLILYKLKTLLCYLCHFE